VEEQRTRLTAETVGVGACMLCVAHRVRMHGVSEI
jgi:hypothetical protein